MTPWQPRGTYADGVLESLTTRAARLVRADARVVLGIAGSPGSGKTTLAADIVGALGERGIAAAYLPMDGFHLANATLDALGRHDRKGAIDTFDGWGFVGLLERIHTERDHPVYAPGFDRAVDEPIAGALTIAPETQIVVAEGNYLLVDEEPWSRIPSLLAEAWFCAAPEGERMRRLVDRHQRHGRTPAAALAWARDVDGANALLIETTLPRAALVVDTSP
ncbi:nucleoside/nucleotide kinase family protein [Diaminobutyricibacter sp. McL0618]|uniref:nucleoside/nucleotide kinase family protein n=1 Tax=Leifsonia sp. McL0618 TaxID=3415677 RepID=UPI003CF82F81